MLKVGDTLGGTFIIEKLLNRGGFGRVWLAADTILERYVAIKELIEVDESRIDNFIREMQIVARLGHKNIIKIHQAIPEDEDVYLVMEYCNSGSIQDELKKAGKISYDQAVSVVIDICAGLEAVHKQGIVHHDIKPANIMVGGDGAVKISDFGIANSSGGTLCYMAPEQFGNDCDHDDIRSDIYSLGITLFELLTGKVPFNGSRGQILNGHLYGDPNFPDYVPAWLVEIIRKALAKHPDLRFQTAAEFAQALEDKQAPALLKPAMLSASIWNAEAEKKMGNQKWYKARFSLEEALKLYPEFSLAHANMGVCYSKLGDSDKAYNHFIKGRKHQTPDVIKSLASLHIEREEYGTAISSLSEYTYRYPLDFEAQNILAQAFYEAGHYERCIELLTTALAKHKGPAFMNNRMIASYLHDGIISAPDGEWAYLKYNLDVMNEDPPSSDNIKTKLLFAPYNHQQVANDLTLSGIEKPFNFSSKNQIVTIGKFTGNEISTGNSKVSRRHCAIIRESKEQWLLVDLQSTNGTKINGQSVRRKSLTAGTYDLDVAGEILILGLY
ncbi:MAG: protein kinase [Desulfuromonadaceae bacterium]|nr:protein kinase [Desulfuromonadaceae bacterium]